MPGLLTDYILKGKYNMLLVCCSYLRFALEYISNNFSTMQLKVVETFLPNLRQSSGLFLLRLFTFILPSESCECSSIHVTN